MTDRNLATESKSRNDRAYGHYSRTGTRYTAAECHALEEHKFNPNHDPQDGRFTSGPSSSNGQGHTVRNGETLSGIAYAHGVRTAVLARANRITNPDRIRAGHVLKIPGRAASHPAEAPTSPSEIVVTAPRHRIVPASASPRTPIPSASPSVSQETGQTHRTAISSEAAAKALVARHAGHYLGKNPECASLTKALAPSVSAASTWQRGELVKGNDTIPVGTPIATFNFYGQKGTYGYGPPGEPGGQEQGQSYRDISRTLQDRHLDSASVFGKWWPENSDNSMGAVEWSP